MIETFIKDIDSGLSSNPKTLPSKYFYDKTGDALFVEIMNLPEYYLTRSELAIFKNKTQQLVHSLQAKPDTYFELIELGAGDGLKTKELLSYLDTKKYNFDYFPIDISANALKGLKNTLQQELPNISVQTKQGDYFEVLTSFKENKKPKAILFLGSNLGNMSDEQATKFIYKLGANLSAGDKLLLGLDLIKSADIVTPAYSDSKGVTAKFNLNLLHRINNELGGNFVLEQFEHQAEYTEEDGIAKSFLVSKVNQTVNIISIDKSYDFLAGEKIQTEISRKYNDKIIDDILSKTDFSIEDKILDQKEYFADYILERK